jgi:hypothetical protein
MLAIPPFVQHSSSLSLLPRSCFRTHFLIHPRLGLVFKVFFSLLFFFLYWYISYSNVTFLCLLDSATRPLGRFRLLDSAAASASVCRILPPLPRCLLCPIWPIWPPLAIGSVPPPHAVTGTPPSEGMALLTLKTLYKVSVTLL